MKKYYPILLSKAGELSALSKLDLITKNEVTPILQVLSGSIKKIENFHSHWNFKDNELFLDFSLMDPFSHITILNLIQHLQSNGVNVVPVIQQNSNQRYIQMIASLVSAQQLDRVCIRFSNDSGGFLNIDTTIIYLTGVLGLNRNQISILLDFGLIGITNHALTATIASNLIDSITNRGDYENIIVSSGSFLDNLGTLNPAGIVYKLPRYEWLIWLTLQSQTKIGGTIKYSDYGTKHPVYSEVNFQGSCSIKYSTINDYMIYRGEISKNHIDGNGQYIRFASQLIISPAYSGSTFSFGDQQINYYAGQIVSNPNRKTGNAGSWVEISQNHHITLLASIL